MNQILKPAMYSYETKDCLGMSVKDVFIMTQLKNRVAFDINVLKKKQFLVNQCLYGVRVHRGKLKNKRIKANFIVVDFMTSKIPTTSRNW